MQHRTVLAMAGALLAVPLGLQLSSSTSLVAASAAHHVAGQWGQCGGYGWHGATKCPNKWACAKQSDWFSLCKPILDEHGCTNDAYAQCGGIGFKGEKCCKVGMTCKKDSDWWSACEPVKHTSKPHSSTSTKHTTIKPTTTKLSTTKHSTTSKPHSTTKHTPKPHSPTTTKPHHPTPPPRASVISKLEELRLSPEWDINAPPRRREYWWEVAEHPGALDGYDRPMLVVNGQYPGPLIEANNGDTVVVHVTNSLDEPVTIHWHGLFQNDTNWEDGPSGVTQCPIGPGITYTYDFPITGEEQYGTFWWHAHRRALYIDGITGPFVIHSKDDPLKRGRDFDIDQLVLLHDHYHRLSDVITDGLISAGGFNGSFIAPSPQSNVVNGAGLYNCSFAAANATCHQKTQLDLPELRFPPNQRVRLRFINEGAHPLQFVSVDEHELTVVEADFTPTLPLPVHRIPIAIAQRYSAILDTSRDKTGDAFYLRAQINTGCLGLPFPDLDPQARVVIRIGEDCDDLGKTLPTSADWNDPTTGNCTDLDAANLHPRIPRDAPSSASQVLVFNSSFALPQNIFKWTLNDQTFENFAYDPLLQRIARGESIPTGRVAVVTAGHLEVVDLVIQNIQGADHPFHLHGPQMYVLSRGPGLITPEQASRLRHNLKNPIRRDVITVSPGTWQVVRIIADIPGVHAFHCHILWHQVQGLLGAFVVEPNVIRTFQIPQDNLALCNGGNASVIDPGRKRSLARPALPAAPAFTGSVAKAKKRKSIWPW